MGKRNERLRPEFIQSASLMLPSPADHQARFKRRRLSDDATDKVALSLLFMRSHRDAEGEKALATCSEDYTHVTDDEDDTSASSGIAVCRTACIASPFGCRPLSRPPRLFHSRLQLALTAVPLPEGRPLPPAPVLPRLTSWSAVTVSQAKA